MDIIVAPWGIDDNDGTREKPFAALARARDAVRELKARHNGQLPDGGVTVWLHGGRDAAFRDLRARGAFLVSARRTDGMVSEVSILSERGGSCRLAMPWDGAAVTLSEEGGVARGVAVGKDGIEFECRPGGRYHMGPVDNHDRVEPTITGNG